MYPQYDTYHDLKKTKVTEQQFIQMVIDEIDQIKKVATSMEIDKLDFTNFHAQRGDCCIYGQMTGMCDSNRAKEIYPKAIDHMQYDRKDCNIIHLKVSGVAALTPVLRPHLSA